jgi:ribosome-associated protein
MEQNRTTPERKRRTGKKAEAEAEATDGAEQVADDAAAGLDERMLAALHAASDKKAHDLVALDLTAVASFTDFFLIGSAANARQAQAIADEVVERLKKQGTRAARVEGYNGAEWVLIDYGDFIFHVFEEKARRFYDLERLWRDAARVELPAELTQAAGGEGSGGAGGSLRDER